MEKKNTQKKLSNKKPLVAIIVGIVTVAVVGTTIAFRSNIVNFFNHAKLGASGATFTEQFVSPTNWKPCDTQPKTVIATNTSNHPIIVRVTYEDYWLTQNNASLPLEQNGLKLGVVNLDHQADWTFNAEDGWYYYNTPLQPGESTNSFMQSVTFNCAYNIGSNELNVCDSEGNCTTPANAYGNANYHVNVTIQTTQDGGDWPKEPICGSSLLYNEIACHTNGTDESVNFRSGSGGNGIFTRSPYANDSYPVYYYRGTIENNYVIWAGFCWQILRTTSTGGVKIIYSGVAQNDDGVQTCNSGPNGRAILRSTTGNDDMPYNYSNYGYGTNTPAQTYYMYGGPYYVTTYGAGGKLVSRTGSVNGFGKSYRWDSGDPIYNYAKMGTSLTYDGTHYAPAGDILRQNFYLGIFDGSDESLITEEMRASHRYFCDDLENMIDNDECKHGVVLIKGDQIFRLYQGELTIQDALDNMLENVNNSDAKEELDKWYAANLTAYTSQLEDTVFCSDRRMSGYLTDPYYATGDDAMITKFGANNTASLADPRVECSRLIDSYTVNASSQGNGMLTYPVGLPTVQEALMAGSVYNMVHYKSWITNTRRPAWTMTPQSVRGAGSWGLMYIIGDYTMTADERACDSNEVRPVVSLKPGTRFRTGNGTANQPYIIK
jgi:hypothetical protein